MNVFVLMALAAWYVPDINTLFTDEYCRNPAAVIQATATLTGLVPSATAAI